MENPASVNNASTSCDLAVYGMLPTYSRRPSPIAWGTCGPGRLNAEREVLVRGEGEVSELSSDLMRQLGELKARPSVRTFS